MKQILAFGDSNTWGLIPGSSPNERYPWGIRWTSLLQDRLKDARVIEEGLCGRTTVFEDEIRPGRNGAKSLSVMLESHYPLDLAIIMLGTNDCKSFYHASASTIGKGIDRCIEILERYLDPSRILLVSPMRLGEDVWREDKDPDCDKESVVVSRQLKDVYLSVSKERGTNFLAASDIVEPSPIDNEHMDIESHRIFADCIFEKITALY
jgi:hypothetical protein